MSEPKYPQVVVQLGKYGAREHLTGVLGKYGAKEHRRGPRGKAWWEAMVFDHNGKLVGACLHQHRVHARADACALRMLLDRISQGKVAL